MEISVDYIVLHCREHGQIAVKNHCLKNVDLRGAKGIRRRVGAELGDGSKETKNCMCSAARDPRAQPGRGLSNDSQMSLKCKELNVGSLQNSQS